MKKIITAILLAFGLLVPVLATAPQAEAATLMRSGRFQFYGANNALWDIPWAQYSDGTFDVTFTLWSNSPRAYIGLVGAITVKDWAVTPTFLAQQGSPSRVSLCSNSAADDFYSYYWGDTPGWVYDFGAFNVSYTYQDPSAGNQGGFEGRRPSTGAYIISGGHWYWAGDSRTGFGIDGGCVSYYFA